MTNFESLIGQNVVIVSPAFNNGEAPEKVRLHGIDHGGVWIESQLLTDRFLETTKEIMANKTLITFLPFWKISLAFSAADMPSISSKIMQDNPV